MARNSENHTKGIDATACVCKFTIVRMQEPRLKSKHPLIIGLILPGRAMDHMSPLVLARMMTMDVASNKNIRDRLYYHRDPLARGERVLPPQEGARCLLSNMAIIALSGCSNVTDRKLDERNRICLRRDKQEP